MKAWKGYHFNGVGTPKPKTEDDVQFLLNAETIDKALILNFLELQVQTQFVQIDQDDDNKIN